MKTKVTIDGLEYNLDIERAKELGVLEEKNARCKSWGEFLVKYMYKSGYLKLERITCPIYTEQQLTQEEAVAISAFSKLLKLRRDWIGDWKPNKFESMICIELCDDFEEFQVNRVWKYPRTFSFPTEEMAEEFLECFKDLFYICKHLV